MNCVEGCKKAGPWIDEFIEALNDVSMHVYKTSRIYGAEEREGLRLAMWALNLKTSHTSRFVDCIGYIGGVFSSGDLEAPDTLKNVAFALARQDFQDAERFWTAHKVASTLKGHHE